MGLFDFVRKNKSNEENKFDLSQIKSINEIFAEKPNFEELLKNNADMINRQFVKEGIKDNVRIGFVSCPSGRIAVGDPLAYMLVNRTGLVQKLEVKIPAGEYPVDISIVKSEYFAVRICTARLKITDKKAVRYEPANSTEETSVSLKNAGKSVPGFPVDAGMAAFMDETVCNEYSSYIDKWYKDHPDKNHYDDYFAAFFAESYNKYPDLQREGGDFIEWTVPDTEHKTVFFASGFGDGFYIPFWGYSDDNELCELIIPFVDAEEIERAERGYDQMQSLIPKPEGCFVTNKALEEGKVGYLYREEPSKDAPDSGWRLFAGDESDEYVNNSENIRIMPLSYICRCEPELLPLLNAPFGSAYYLDENGEYKEEK